MNKTKYGKFMYNLCLNISKKLNSHIIIYYILSYTWGLMMTSIGLITSLILLICGKKPIKYGKTFYFKIFKRWGGLELGHMFVRDKTSSEHVNYHEYGHTFQNAILGPLFIPLVSIPSAIRYWYRNFLFRFKFEKYCKLSDYDSIWFEGNATDIGKLLINKEVK